MVTLNRVGGSLASPSYHSLQAQALLQGHFYLSDSITQIQPGLAWYHGRVQQVWGLGIGLVLVPFVMAKNIFSTLISPERFALGCAFTLLAFYCFSTGAKKVRNSDKIIPSLGFIWLILLCPALWCLARGPQLIFEETVIYAILLSFGILVAVIRVVLFNSLSDFYICCALGAFSGFIRPTHIAYSLAGFLACWAAIFLRTRSNKHVITGAYILLIGFFLLGLTNWLRFGSPLEFGHNLTITNPGLVYLTRFGNPFDQASISEAFKEQFGLLFLTSNIQGQNVFTENLFPGQSSQVRWRSLYLSTFDLSYFCIFTLVTIGVTVLLLQTCWRKEISKIKDRQSHLMATGLLIWACSSIFLLSSFYLYFPTITSRYLLDFAPAFAGCFLVFWYFISKLCPKSSIIIIGVWTLIELTSTKVPSVLKSSVSKSNLVNWGMPNNNPLHRFSGNYTLAQHPAQSGINSNGDGWDNLSGIAQDIVMVAVDRPEFVELVVSDRLSEGVEQVRKDVYQAKIGNQSLSIKSIEREEQKLRIWFDLPNEIKAQSGDEFLFVCFSTNYDLQDRESSRLLYSIRWR